jgi:hypothetical protein
VSVQKYLWIGIIHGAMQQLNLTTFHRHDTRLSKPLKLLNIATEQEKVNFLLPRTMHIQIDEGDNCEPPPF